MNCYVHTCEYAILPVYSTACLYKEPPLPNKYTGSMYVLLYDVGGGLDSSVEFSTINQFYRLLFDSIQVE